MNKMIIIGVGVVVMLVVVGVIIYFATKEEEKPVKKSPAGSPPSGTPPAGTPPAGTPPATPSGTLPSDINFVKGWSGNHENPGGKVAGAEQCRQLALNSNGKYVAWGFRNNSHPEEQWKNTCFLYTQGFAPYNGNADDNIHTTGCLRTGEKVEWGCKTSAPQKAKFYEHCDYQGGVSELGPGDYNINAMGIGNDIISSVRVPSGIKVILYEHGDFQGRTLELTSDAPCLVNQGFNDVVSGIKVIRI